MKKTLLLSILAIACMLIGFTSCDPKAKKQETTEITTSSLNAGQEMGIVKDFFNDLRVVKNDGQLSPEHVAATNRQYMYNQVGGDYILFETEVKYAEKFNDSTHTGNIEQIRNIFQKVTPIDKGFYVEVWQAITKKSGTIYFHQEDFVVGDEPINDVTINLTFEQAHTKLMEANCPKPNGSYCVLRLPITSDPKQNPLYLFGNLKAGMVAVDAVTGNTHAYLGGPLGEWP